ncbi:MAG: hypothetical protein Q8S84_02410 [bacterium]|nr:hypothetical protein [bacterium]MDP3380404.1 hypothetical protein [bacterium]
MNKSLLLDLILFFTSSISILLYIALSMYSIIEDRELSSSFNHFMNLEKSCFLFCISLITDSFHKSEFILYSLSDNQTFLQSSQNIIFNQSSLFCFKIFQSFSNHFSVFVHSFNKSVEL